ncbi:phage tail domain-containing protein [Paenibacillus sp. GXUN7292]|uniref:phage tail domain-containing protein n=1 Tax=Paenibacillus sp. GXUN7292 TaxID=3422499 RepID=UPI003D7D3F71
MDNGGATFGGVSFASLGLLLTKAHIPLLPETVQTEEELDGLDGLVDVETKYGPRLIELEVSLITEDETEYQIALQRIAKIFNARAGIKPLVLDRMTGKQWLCKYNGRIPIEKVGSIGEFTLPFKTFFPFSESVTDSVTQLEYGQGYSYGMGLQYAGLATFNVTSSPTDLTVNHAGTHEAYPLIRLVGSGTNIIITNTTTGESLSINQVMSASDVLEIDCRPLEQMVRKNGISSFNGVLGTFPRLVEGVNIITITATGAKLTVSFVFRHTYLY